MLTRARTCLWISVAGAFVAACGARTELHVAGLGGHGGLSTSSTATVTTTTTTSSSSSSSGTGGGCTTDTECGCLLNCCGGRCVNQDNDIFNCGGCGNACPTPNPYCFHGKCGAPACNHDPAACPTGTLCCDTECCSPGQLCCSVNMALTFTKCQAPTASGTCNIGEPCTECASPDTPIETPNGARAIASLRVGDLVYSVEDSAVVVVPVIQTSTTRVKKHRVIEVALANGAVLQISPRHPTADGRLFADLVVGDRLGDVEVVAVKLVPYNAEATHDILPASRTRAYFAGGALIGSTLGAEVLHR